MKKNILLGICGGIASYKSCELVRLLIKGGFSVKVMMTDNAARFVTPLVYETLSKNSVYSDMFGLGGDIQHAALSQWTNLCVIAPITANTLSKIAVGICDNLLTTVVCALPQEVKVLLSPAMNEEMWINPIIKENVEKLKRLGRYIVLEPEKGELACGIYGEGRMPEPIDIYKKILALADKND